MELIIVLAIVGIIVAFLVMQRRKDSTDESKSVNDWPAEPAAPYKVETPAPAPEVVAEVAAVTATAEVAAPVVVDEVVADKPAPKARKPRKPKAVVVADDSAVAAVKKPRKPRSKKA